MNDPGLLQSLVLGLLRGVAAAAGAWLVQKGYITSDQSPQIIGALLLLGSAAFTVIDKLVVKKKIAAALATTPPETPK